jgi:hypothetical protein
LVRLSAHLLAKPPASKNAEALDQLGRRTGAVGAVLRHQHERVQSVIADLETPSGHHRIFISDAEDLRNSKTPSGWTHMTRQGPVGPGKLVDMGSFEGILEYALHEKTGEKILGESSLSRSIHQFEITIIGMYGSEDILIGASRRFEIVHARGKASLRSATVETRQIVSARERKWLAKELAKQL